MSKIVKLTENDLTKLIKKVIKEQAAPTTTQTQPTPPVNQRVNQLAAFLKKFTPAEIAQAQQIIKLGPSPTKVAPKPTRPQQVNPPGPQSTNQTNFASDDGGGFYS